MPQKTIKLWDLPIRMFHWGLVAAMSVSVLAIKTNLLDSCWHLRSGMAITALLMFRLCWGYLGAPSARFSQFWPSPARLIAWRKGRWQGVGHSPSAGLSVFAMLVVLLALLATGIFANDDVSLQGPLAQFVSETFSDQASAWHAWLFNGCLGLVGLHLVAIAYYHLVKRDSLVPAMVHGKRQVNAGLAMLHTRQVAEITCPAWLRLLLSLAISAAITLGLFSESVHHWLSPPAIVAPTARPAW